MKCFPNLQCQPDNLRTTVKAQLSSVGEQNSLSFFFFLVTRSPPVGVRGWVWGRAPECLWAPPWKLPDPSRDCLPALDNEPGELERSRKGEMIELFYREEAGQRDCSRALKVPFPPFSDNSSFALLHFLYTSLSKKKKIQPDPEDEKIRKKKKSLKLLDTARPQRAAYFLYILVFSACPKKSLFFLHSSMFCSF